MYKLKIDYENKDTREKEMALADILRIASVATKHKAYAKTLQETVSDTVKTIRSSRKNNFAVVTLSRNSPIREVKDEQRKPFTVSREVTTLVEENKGGRKVNSIVKSRSDGIVDLVVKRTSKGATLQHQMKVQLNEEAPSRGAKKLRTKKKANPILLNAVRELKDKIKAEVQALRREAVSGTFNPLMFNDKVTKVKGKRSLHSRPTLEQLLVSTELGSLPGFKVLRDKKNLTCYYEPGTFLKAQDFKSLSDMLAGKTRAPRFADRHVGIEIELLSKIGRKALGEKIHAAGVSRYVAFTGDGSLRSDETHREALELRVCVKESELEAVLTKLCAVLEQHCKVNGSCGLHVHLDMRGETGRDPKLSYHNLCAMQHFMYRMLPTSRYTGQYSKPNVKKEWGVAEGGRYLCVNQEAFSKHKTIELRPHSGTVNATKIINWCKMLMAIANAPYIGRSPTTLAGFQLATGVDASVLGYIQGRLHKFKQQHDKAKLPITEVKFDEPSAPTPTNNEESET